MGNTWRSEYIEDLLSNRSRATSAEFTKSIGVPNGLTKTRSPIVKSVITFAMKEEFLGLAVFFAPPCDCLPLRMRRHIQEVSYEWFTTRARRKTQTYPSTQACFTSCVTRVIWPAFRDPCRLYSQINYEKRRQRKCHESKVQTGKFCFKHHGLVRWSRVKSLQELEKWSLIISCLFIGEPWRLPSIYVTVKATP